MAEFKRRTLLLSTGKQLRLFGNSLAIGKTLEVGEGGAPNIFSCFINAESEKASTTVFNPYKLTAEELHEIADFNIRLWVDFKESIRKYGINNPKIFVIEKQSEVKIPEKKQGAEKQVAG